VVNNAGAGIVFNSADTTGNVITGGSITGHSGKGIALTNGANGAIVPPAITRMAFGTTFIVSGTSTPNATVQIYADPDDEGLEFLASTTATASGTLDEQHVVVAGHDGAAGRDQWPARASCTRRKRPRAGRPNSPPV